MKAALAFLIAVGACASRSAPATLPVVPDPGPPEAPVTAAAPDPAPTPPPAPVEPPAPAAPTELDDDHLIANVRRAVSEHVAPDALEAQVGQKPLVNTRNGALLAVLRRVKLVPDTAHADEKLDLASAEAVMYWRRPIDREDPHFVGIQLRKDGTAAVFFAVLLPP